MELLLTVDGTSASFTSGVCVPAGTAKDDLLTPPLNTGTFIA